MYAQARCLAVIAIVVASMAPSVVFRERLSAADAEPASSTGKTVSKSAADSKTDALEERLLSLNKQAIDAYGQGKYQQACDLEDQALAISSEIPDLWENKGNFLLSAGKSADALVCFDKAIALKPEASSLASKAGSLSNLGRFPEAITAAGKAIQLDGKYWKAWNNRAQVYYLLGDLSHARTDIDKTIEINPQAASAIAMRGSIKMRANDLDGALADMDQALRIDPNNGPFLCSRATLSWKQKDKDSAVKFVQKASQLSPNNPDINTTRVFMETHSIDEPFKLTKAAGMELDLEQKKSFDKSADKPGK